MKYLLPGSITLAMFVSVMIGGGMLYIDDKARGIHEGYLVTPITKAEMVFGLNLAGAIKAVLTGVVITVIGALLAGVSTIFNPATALGLLLMIVLTSIAFNTMMFLLMVRVDDPLVPRAIFGILNTLLFFPSGSIYPVQAFPAWLRVIAKVAPFPYAVAGFKGLLLKQAGFMAIVPDMLYLGIFGTVAPSAGDAAVQTDALGRLPRNFCGERQLRIGRTAYISEAHAKAASGAVFPRATRSCRLHQGVALLTPYIHTHYP
jgi:ABC-2 type transport system permease protein